MEVHHIELENLKPNSSYSCVVETEGVGVGTSCQFFTHGHIMAGK